MNKPLCLGDELAPVREPPLTRARLALYAGASGDDNPLHIDSDYAKALGREDVIGHGMLGMALLSKVLTDNFPIDAIQSFKVRFTAPLNLHEDMLCSAVVEAVNEDRSLALQLRLSGGTELKLAGTAVVRSDMDRT